MTNISKFQDVREAAVAGKFYPENKTALINDIERFFSQVPASKAKGMITGLIVPHAGYQFSGQVAAAGFKEIIGEEIDTVILVGNSHRERFDGISVYPEGAFMTPLGTVEIDSALATALTKSDPRIRPYKQAHVEEHSLEVELPFLQEALTGFKIVPILFGNSSEDDYKILADAIVKNIKGKNIIVVASSDLSHYPSYSDAVYSDNKVIKSILTGNPQNFKETIREIERKKLPNEVTCACGDTSIMTLMEVEKILGAKEIKLLSSANSGDVSGDKNRVVGYASIGFFAERRGDLLNKDEQRELLKIAKDAVELFVASGETKKIDVKEPMLNQRLGAFVTLREEGELRGCIGRFSPTDIPLYEVVQQMAISAATKDFRFKPVSKGELKSLSYEISVLSPLQRVANPGDIVLRRDGVKIVKGQNSGVFLPQVAIETGWNFNKFMAELCTQKAGLEPFCWKDKETELYTFTAQVFGK